MHPPSNDKPPETITIHFHVNNEAGSLLVRSIWQWKSPDKWRRQIHWLDRSGGGYAESGFDGHTAWERTDRRSTYSLSDKEAGQAHDFFALEHSAPWRTVLRKAEPLGTDHLGDADVYRVRETYIDGRTDVAFFDAKTFFLLRKDWTDAWSGNVLFITEYFSDYRRGHGLTVICHLHRVMHHGTPVSRDVHEEDLFVDSIETNLPIADTEFSRPSGRLSVPAKTPSAKQP